MSDDASSIAELARGWFGYGQWDADYWFVGMEPGGDELPANLRMWAALGKQPLVDMQSYSEPGDDDWFSEASKPQSTWTRLIWLLLTYKGEKPSSAATLYYQRHHLGRANGETALIELSAICSPTAATDEARRVWFRAERIAELRARLLRHRPRFAVFYSASKEYEYAWNAITRNKLIEGIPVLVGRTACVMTCHPQARWARAYWVGVAQRLREISASPPNAP